MPQPDPDRCPVCGLTYRNFRTGFKYGDIYALFWMGPDPETWVYKRRGTILGKWHQIKLDMWEEHLDLCERHLNETS